MRYILAARAPYARRARAALCDMVSGEIGNRRRIGSEESPYASSAFRLLSRSRDLHLASYHCVHVGDLAIYFPYL